VVNPGAVNSLTYTLPVSTETGQYSTAVRPTTLDIFGAKALGSNEASSLKAVFAGGNNFTQSPRIAWERSDIINNTASAWTTVATVTLPLGATFHDLNFTMPPDCDLNAVKFRAKLITGGNCGEFVSDEAVIVHGGWAQVINAQEEAQASVTFPSALSLQARSVTHWRGTNTTAIPPIDRGYVGGTLQRYTWVWRTKYYSSQTEKFYFSAWQPAPVRSNTGTSDNTLSAVILDIPVRTALPQPNPLPLGANLVDIQVQAIPSIQYTGCRFDGVSSNFTIVQSATTLIAQTTIDNNGQPTNFNSKNLGVVEDNTSNPLALLIQPNPAADNILVQFTPPTSGTFAIEILDMLQRKLGGTSLTSYRASRQGEALNLSYLVNGIYTLRLYGTDDKGRFYSTTQRLTILK
jgi:hypothetical protein